MRYFIIALILIISSAQTRVTPKSQACECADLLNQADCSSKNDCQWKFTVIQNSAIQKISTTSGTCTKLASTSIVKIQYCSVLNILQCASTFGCALVNNTCTIFAGCQAYAKKSNAACQSISTQCTTDGISCVKPTACSIYSTKELCTKNLSTSGAKSCLWKIQGAKEKCEDKICSDAPKSLKTQSQCNNWIAGCLSNGKGCTSNLRPCSNYQKANGCLGMIGSDGSCIADPESSVCKIITCMDAPKIYSTNQACEEFLTGCQTNGKGCVPFLSSCDKYNQEQGCAGLIGLDGPCTANKIKGSDCRVLQCTDAPASANTNEACSKFLSGCITTGLGCTNQLKTCQTYQGAAVTCALFIGTDGKCKGSSSKEEHCISLNCEDAPNTMNSNATCNGFKLGCLTTGAGCTSSLQSCNSYLGTNITCTQYIGRDGNCTAPSTQTTRAPCSAKICTDAPKTIKTNSGCQAFSYLCVTNGAGCQYQQVCETTELQISCQGQQSCAFNQICLNRSSCENYLTKSQCMLNQQQYQTGGIIYLRPCNWSELLEICQNVQCVSLLETLSNDETCSQSLQGCLTKGAGCVDVKDPCTNYSGLSQKCENFKGINGTQKCSQLITVTDPYTPCTAKTQCHQANQLSSTKQTSNASCRFFLQGCFFDGKDNCTKGDCTSYFGTFDLCVSITSALSELGPQLCWKTTNLNDPTTACEVKQCNQASPQSSYQSNEQCYSFLKGCVWNGQEAGGCFSPQTLCQYYYGTHSTCSNFYESNRKCSKTTDICKPLVCTNKIPPSTATTHVQKGIYCQGFTELETLYTCQMGQGSTISCVSPSEKSCSFFVAVGEDNQSKADYCQGLNYPGYDGCGYSGGDFCDQAQCNQFTATGLTADQKAKYCQNLMIDGQYVKCGLASSLAIQCSVRECTDYEIITQQLCEQYQYICTWSQLINSCYLRKPNCSDYNIIPEYTNTELLKVKYCASLLTNNFWKCTYLWHISQTTCSNSPQQCTNISFPPLITTYQEKLLFCVTQKNYSGLRNCNFELYSPQTCVEKKFCNEYLPHQNIIQNNYLISNQIPCIINCWNCVISQANCSTYDTYGESVAENQEFCSQWLSINSLRRCTSNQSGPSKCQELVCEDFSSESTSINCTSSNSCIFDGIACVTLNVECSGYTAQDVGQGKQINCSKLKAIDYNNDKCGWTSGDNCSNRVCTQLRGQMANKESCLDYIDICQYDGQSCVTIRESCLFYEPHGETNEIKAAICNQMIAYYWIKCGWIPGSITCLDIFLCENLLPQPITQAFDSCSLAQNYKGEKCGFSPGQQSCSPKKCNQAVTAQSYSDCNNYMKGCEQDLTISQCSSKICLNAPQTLITNIDCTEYRIGCLTNGAGCMESTEPCSKYNGTQHTCNGFIGNNIPCTNIQTAISSDACIDRTCVLNTTARSNGDCSNWYPPTNGFINCVWGGSLGCVPLQPCESFLGTVESCLTFIASNGPCFGTGSVKSPSSCISNNLHCIAAPKTFNTDELCKNWGQACLTNGFGCIQQEGATCQSIQSPDACQIYKRTPGLYCDLALQCKTKPSTCDEILNPFECNNTPLLGQDQQQCGWDSNLMKCIPIKCSLLPTTLVTDKQCRSIISNCTTNGAGCITKGACSSYPKQACGIAETTDTQKACIWSNSACRPIECTDNTSATSDIACDTFLVGCRSPGQGCLLKFHCSVITKADLCLFDTEGQPCLWYKSSARIEGTCINYSQCSDIISPIHEECQAVSPFCTTNGINCIAITSCSRTIFQVSCIIGTDGQCGWKPATDLIPASCQLNTSCSMAQGKTHQECQLWGSNCTSDGKNCIEITSCGSYLKQISCNLGTNGVCFWVAPTQNTIGFCRVQVCSDASTNLTTHTECVSLQASTACTTSGTACIEQTSCSSYQFRAGCHQGTDGFCWWVQTQDSSKSYCRLKQCTDLQFKQSSLCKQEPGVKCVSNGSNCVPQSPCQSYTTREACQGGGSDGFCAFTQGANTETPNFGTCSLFTQCSDANSDQIACVTRQDACYFKETPFNGTVLSQCLPHTCATKAQGTSCQPVPSWDLSSYQICIQSGTSCVEGNPKELNAQTCYNNSVGTYTWDVNISLCVACRDIIIGNVTNLDNIQGILMSMVMIIMLCI